MVFAHGDKVELCKAIQLSSTKIFCIDSRIIPTSVFARKPETSAAVRPRALRSLPSSHRDIDVRTKG